MRHPLQDALETHNLSNVLKMQQQLTYDECERLIEAFGKNAVWTTLRDMNNWKPLARKNVSVYDTCRNWLNRTRKAAAKTKEELYTFAGAMSWMGWRKLPNDEFDVYFEKAGKDEKTGKQLFKRRKL